MVAACYEEHQILWAVVATDACLTFASGAGRAERLALGFLVSSSETEPMPAALQTFDKMPVASSPRFCVASVYSASPQRLSFQDVFECIAHLLFCSCCSCMHYGSVGMATLLAS